MYTYVYSIHITQSNLDLCHEHSNPNDPVTWHMVQQQQQQLQFGDAVSNEIRIRILVGEKGRLGCGVCRGIVPGLTVQVGSTFCKSRGQLLPPPPNFFQTNLSLTPDFNVNQGTRENGPARAAGLRAGDIILWCNGVSLTDLPFERAIEVMRGASILDLVVNRPILVQSTVQSTNLPATATSAAAPAAERPHYDCPENLWGPRGSSGYDSENSSLGQHQPMSPQHHRNAMTMRPNCNRNAGLVYMYMNIDAKNRPDLFCLFTSMTNESLLVQITKCDEFYIRAT